MASIDTDNRGHQQQDLNDLKTASDGISDTAGLDSTVKGLEPILCMHMGSSKRPSTLDEHVIGFYNILELTEEDEVLCRVHHRTDSSAPSYGNRTLVLRLMFELAACERSKRLFLWRFYKATDAYTYFDTDVIVDECDENANRLKTAVLDYVDDLVNDFFLPAIKSWKDKSFRGLFRGSLVRDWNRCRLTRLLDHRTCRRRWPDAYGDHSLSLAQADWNVTVTTILPTVLAPPRPGASDAQVQAQARAREVLRMLDMQAADEFCGDDWYSLKNALTICSEFAPKFREHQLWLTPSNNPQHPPHTYLVHGRAGLPQPVYPTVTLDPAHNMPATSARLLSVHANVSRILNDTGLYEYCMRLGRIQGWMEHGSV